MPPASPHDATAEALSAPQVAQKVSLTATRKRDLTHLAQDEARGTDDARVVLVLRDHDGGVGLDAREELLRVLRHATTDDEQVGREEELDVRVELLQTLGPAAPRDVFALTSSCRGVTLDGVALPDEVAELGVRNELAVEEEGGTDTRAERRHDRQAGLVLRDT